MNDLKVYYEATKDFLVGNNPYQHSYELKSGYFKYAPPTLFLFSLLTFFEFSIVKFFHLGVSILMIFIVIPLWYRLLKEYFVTSSSKKSLILNVSFLIIVIHVTREFHLGNVNLILLGLFVVGYYLIVRNRTHLGLFLWAIMVLLKPIMIFTFIPLIINRKWKELGVLILFGCSFLLIPMVFIDSQKNFILWADWIKAIVSHGTYLKSPQSLQYLFHNFFDVQISWFYSIICLIILITLNIIEVIKNGVNQESTLFWSIIYVAFIPSFFITDTEHFIMTLPLIMFLLYSLIQIKSKSMWLLFFFGILFYSFDSMDLLGRKLSTLVYDNGILGIGNLIFITLGIILWNKYKFIISQSNNQVEN